MSPVAARQPLWCRYWAAGGILPRATHSARINERCFEWLDAPVLRVTAHDVPLPYAPALEDFVLPQTADIVLAARRLAAY